MTKLDKMKRKHSITYDIPGGLYGNDPGSFASDINAGNVVVLPEAIDPALRWLKRRADIIGTFLSPNGDGIGITYTLKERKIS